MGRRDPLIEELFEVVRRDLEEVVNSEVEGVKRISGCVEAKVYEDAIFLEISVLGGLVAGLPSQHTFYVKKSNVYKVSLEVEVLRDEVRYVLAKMHLWYLKDQEQTCYMEIETFQYGINGLAKDIIVDFNVWSKGDSIE